MMWLRLGEDEMVNLSYAYSIKKGNAATIEVQLLGGRVQRVIPFPSEDERDLAFDKLLENLSRLRLALE